MTDAAPHAGRRGRMEGAMREFRILEGDVIERLAELPDNSFDGCLTDPPYGLSFMGKRWDYAVPGPDVWAEVLRVLKPGAMLLAFGGTRTHHRLWCAIEDAGFEVRDCLMWLYGSGFPKSANISKNIDKAAGAERVLGEIRTDGRGKWDLKMQKHDGDTGVGHADGSKQTYRETHAATDAAKRWDGYGTALKPAYEPILLAMKPVDGTFANNALTHGVAGLNVDGSRVAYEDTPNPATNPLYRVQNDYRVKVGSDKGGSSFSVKPEGGEVTANAKGRWPANVIHDGSEEVTAGFPESANSHFPKQRGRGGAITTAGMLGQEGLEERHNSAGSAARFFYVPKAAAERNIGGVKNTHPTVKPIDLCAYLAKLILPPERETPRRLLVPFSGSGSEIIGATRTGWDEVVGIELNPEYAEMARRRILDDSPMFNVEAAK